MPAAARFRVGECDCWALADGELTYPASLLLPPDGRVEEQVRVPYTAILIHTGSRRILIDTGAGPLGPDTGKLPESLAAAGFSPTDIDTVILSHPHPGHIAGVPRFPRAEVVMMRKEYEFWTAAETQSRLEASTMYGLGPLEPLMAACVRNYLAPARDRLRLLEQPEEVAAGVLVFPAPGHTPGHAAVLLSSGRQQLLYVGDAIVHLAQFEHPDWVSAFDLWPDQTVRTRKQLLERAAVDRCLVAGYHLPGGIGSVLMQQARFHWDSAVGFDVTP
jgi:glyoxylase-like metal-dependent hydrolase (beta-lactamase superfamily II)